MTPDERQRARERAADGIAPRHSVVVGERGWATPLNVPGLNVTRKRKWYRDRASSRTGGAS